MSPTLIIAAILLVFVPISLAANFLDWGAVAICLTSAVAIAALSFWLSTATKKIASVTGTVLGGWINALFGNATALIITIVSLKAGLVDLVKSSITGSILGNLLLAMGLALLVGSLHYGEQTFQPQTAKINGPSMTLAVIAIALPTVVINTSLMVSGEAIHQLCLIVATLLLLVYGLTVFFSFQGHNDLESPGQKKEEKSPFIWLWVGVLLISTLVVAYESDLLASNVEETLQGLHLTPLFVGVILVPLVSDVASIVTVVRLSFDNQMDLAVATVMEDSRLVALALAPVLVWVGQAIHQPMDLNFNLFEAISLAVAVTTNNLISFSGRSNWLDGALLLTTYAILGVAFYYHPA